MKKGRLSFVLQLAIILLAILCLLLVTLRSGQSHGITVMPQQFLGEYSRDGQSWLPLDEKADLSAAKGDLLLRGHLLRDIPGNAGLYFYHSHLVMDVSVNGEPFYSSTYRYLEDYGNRYLGDICGRYWSFWPVIDPLPADAFIEIRLHNPHAPGNPDAYRLFLNTLCVESSSSAILKQNLSVYGHPFRMGGLTAILVASLIIGASAVAGWFRLPVASRLWKCGFLTLTAGGVFYFDAIDISFVQETISFYSYGLWICIFLFVLWLGFCTADFLTGRRKRIALILSLFSAAADLVLIFGSVAGWWLLRDAGMYWCVLQLILIPAQTILCLRQLKRADRRQRRFLFSAIILYATVLLDIFGVGRTILSRMNCTKIAFPLAFLFLFVIAAAGVLANQQAAARAQKLERELEESRIAIMLNQIQPHFLYNALTAVMDLCDSDPQAAKTAIADFSRYLRANLASLKSKEAIPFDKELEHIRTYLRLEHLRFKERLNVEYDISVSHFLLPALSIQPLVENAVKHGLMKKPEGGTVRISTAELPDAFLITVSDDGIGFDEKEAASDGKIHVGLENIRGRLALADAALSIQTEKGHGTTVTVTVPKGRDQ